MEFGMGLAEACRRIVLEWVLVRMRMLETRGGFDFKGGLGRGSLIIVMLLLVVMLLILMVVVVVILGRMIERGRWRRRRWMMEEAGMLGAGERRRLGRIGALRFESREMLIGVLMMGNCWRWLER